MTQSEEGKRDFQISDIVHAGDISEVIKHAQENFLNNKHLLIISEGENGKVHWVCDDGLTYAQQVWLLEVCKTAILTGAMEDE